MTNAATIQAEHRDGATVRQLAAKYKMGTAAIANCLSIAARTLELIRMAGAEGRTIGEIARVIYGADPTCRRCNTIRTAVRDLRRRGVVAESGAMRGVTPGKEPGVVFVVAILGVEKPAPVAARGRQRPRASEREYAVVAEEATAPDLLRAVSVLRSRFSSVVPLKGGRVIVGSLELVDADVIALARGEVSVAELLGVA